MDPGFDLTPQQRLAFRLAGYFCLAVAALASLQWLMVVYEDYVQQRRWPSLSGSVMQVEEHSDYVQPADLSRRRQPIYWAGFMVILDVPFAECPAERWTPSGRQVCLATIKTRVSSSRVAVIHAIQRYPRGSKVIVHYDPRSDAMALEGLPVFDYVWDKAALTIGILVAGGLLLVVGRRN